MRRLWNRLFGCRADVIGLQHPSGEFVLLVCSESCGTWGATYRGEVLAGGTSGLGSDEFAEVANALRKVGRFDLADSVVRIEAALERQV